MFKFDRLIKLILLSFFLNLFVYGGVPRWYSNLKKIKIMETKRFEVEELFSFPKIVDSELGEFGNYVEYKLKIGILSVTYSNGNCSEKSGYGYDVAKDIVTDFELDLDKNVNNLKLGINLVGFERAEISDLPGMFNYRNEKLGEYYLTRENYKDGSIRLSHLEFFPSIAQESLTCENTPTKK
jgi:hypothetical protein